MANLINGLLTIGIPTFNGADNLAAVIASVNNLGLSDDLYEILVVDNCSADKTDEVIESLKPSKKNIRYHKNEKNIGRIENWNRVIDLAQGEYLIIMNVNDRFEQFDIQKQLNYLKQHKEVALVMTDIKYVDHVYPQWIEEGILDMETYIRKTFFDTDYLEFHSLGVLHQHIFRTATIIEKNIRFDPIIPRTTDRVFTAQIIKAAGGKFYYVPENMVSWHLSGNRYHFNVHNNQQVFDFEQLWVNEYKANMQIAGLTNISYAEIMHSQLILAAFFNYVRKMRRFKSWFKKEAGIIGMEIPTANVFYAYLKANARLTNTRINYIRVKKNAFNRMTRWYLRSLGILKPNKRTLKDIISI